jgi:hypothetical protein
LGGRFVPSCPVLYQRVGLQLGCRGRWGGGRQPSTPATTISRATRPRMNWLCRGEGSRVATTGDWVLGWR